MKTGSAIVLVFAIWFGYGQYSARRDQRHKAWADCMNSYPMQDNLHAEKGDVNRWQDAQSKFCAGQK